ncbi:PorT family protein [Fibrella sp. HMF5335]|uniref:PorT family protein n=1 Tax=Fibrella rubiginis TaxID=2817060 RepID=A0A939GGQ7_9BACT|nr:PorT family protein [Fibrella rubiginis]MBO0937160.1 PorT family protein [Fibrella rubiginis]
MQEWPDDHLDDLFRKSAEEFDVPFDPAHWTDMNNRLDEHDRQGFYDRWRVWGGAAALTGLLLVTLWWARKVTTVAANPMVESTLHQSVNSKKTAEKPQQAERALVTTNATNSTAKRKATAYQLTDSRPTPGVVKPPVATPDWAARSRVATGQWRRRAATNVPLERQNLAVQKLRTSTGATQDPAADGRPAHNPLLVEHSTRTASGKLARVKAVKRKQAANKQPVDEQDESDNELVIALNQTSLPTRKQAGESKPTLADRRVVAGTSNVTVKTAPNGHWSDRSPEPTSSANTPVKRLGGFLDQPQATPQVSARPAEPGTSGTSQPADIATVERLQFAMVSPATALTSVKTTPLSTLQEPEWDNFDRPAQRVFLPRQRLSVMAVFSPDFSAIGLRDFTKPGSNAGLMFQYRLSERFVVQTGAIISTKKYETESEYYVFPWTWTPQPESIAGTCTMYDIPVNLRYDWLRRPMGDGMPPARWFASAGLTSYFIKHENYVYTYADPTNPAITKNRLMWDNLLAGKPGGSFGFSNVNLSVGYERPLARHLSWQVEPFMKIPLQQVGFFKVRLLSTGAFVGLKYSL